MSHETFSDELKIAAAQNIEEKNYWLNNLSGELFKNHFPYDHNRKTEGKRPLEVVNSVFSADTSLKLMELSNNSDLRLFVIMATGLVALLTRYTPNKDIIIGTSIYRQNTEEKFINTLLPLRVQVENRVTFKELLMNVGQVIFEANKHQNYPVEALLDYLGMPLIEDEDFPLFDIAVQLDNIHDKSYLRHINLNMVVIFKRMKRDIQVAVEYNPLLYKNETIEQIITHLGNFFKNAVFNVNERLGDMEILSQEEKKKILFDFNDTKAEYSRNKAVNWLFEEQVERTPNSIAVVFDGQAVSYDALNLRANQLARELRKRGVKPNSFVGVIIERSVEMVLGVMAVLKAGGAYVPLESYLPDARVIICFSALNVVWVLTNRSQLTKLFGIKGELPALKYIFCLDQYNSQVLEPSAPLSESLSEFFSNNDLVTLEKIGENSGENIETAATPEDIAYIIFTSGTTGTPKGVVEKHRPVINIIEWVNRTFEVTAPDKLLFVVSLSFDLSVYDIFGILASGASLRVVAQDDLKSPECLLEIIFREGITFWDSAPAALQQLLPFIQELYNFNYNTSKNLLRLVFLSGDWIPTTMPDILKEAFEGVKVIALGGATEATIWSNYYRIEHVDIYWKSIPYGKPIQNAKYYILDDIYRPCPIGVPGNLFIGGECLASGYINDETLTAEKFIDNPFVAGEKIYRTGDMARWFPDGNMEFLGRLDNQVKIRGFRIELGEIETQLLANDDIEAAVVLAKGELKGDKYLCAYYISDKEFTSTELSEYLSRTLPSYMIPSYFLKLDKIPLTQNGKVDKKALPEPDLKQKSAYTEPTNEIEKKIVEIWAEVLIIEKESISIDANFFELGGHSLNATILVSKIHKNLNIRIPLAELFKVPTIKGLSSYIQNAEKETFASIEPVEEKEYYELASAQKRLYILQQMRENNIAYNMFQGFPISKDIDIEKLLTVFNQLITRHETLRTSFEMLGGKSIQKIHKNIELSLQHFKTDETGLGNVAQSFIRPFDLSKAPLLRVGLVQIDSPSPYYYLLVDMHHIISDEGSQVLLQKEFFALSKGLELSPLRLQYKDFSEWENSHVQQKGIKKQEAYWLKQFDGVLPMLNLPLDFPRPSIQSNEGCTVGFHLPSEGSAALKTIVRQEGVTMFMVLLMVYNLFLMKLCTQEDIIVGAPVAGRKHSDLQKIIGAFINSIALRNYPRGEKIVKEFLNEVKINTLEAFENQEYPFDDLVDKIIAERDASRNPIFNVMLNLVNREDYLNTIEDEVDDGRNSYNHVKGNVRFDMNLVAIDYGEKVFFIFFYCSALFKAETIDRFIGYFKRIISQLTGNLNRSIADIEIIPEIEKQKLLLEFNNFAADYPHNKTLIQLFEEQVNRTPDCVALVFEDTRITYRQLNEQANRLGRLLSNKGVRPDTLVSLMVQRSIEMVVGIWGILKSGGAYLPVNPEAPEDRITYMLDNASVNIILTQEKFIEKFANRYQVINLNSLTSYKNSCTNSECKNIPTDLAYVIYTSGSTGKPKGVMIQNRSVINIVKWFAAQYDLKPGFQLLQMFEYTFDASINQIFGSMLHGVTLHVIRKEYFFDIEFLRDYIVTHFINLINFVQSVIKEVLCGREKIGSLKYVISGAEKLKSTIKNEILDNGYALYNQYGPTEVTVDALAEKCSYESNGTVGVPVYNAQCYIVNPFGRLNPLGVAGELWVGGDGLARGYINNVELTAEKFTSTAFIPGIKVYKTGDLTRWLPAGNVEFLGRIDTQIKIRGFRIEPVEIANQLVKIDGIKEAVVIDRENASGETYLCAYLVGEEETEELENSEVKDILSRSLPDYMIPSYYVWIDRLPLSGHGKLIRSALPEPDLTIAELYVPPSNFLEKKLVEIWSEVLDIDKQIIGVNTDFFEIGGHSLKATLLISKIHKELNVKIPLAEMFRAPTVKDMAKIAKTLKENIYSSINPVEKKEYYELSSTQKRLYFLQQFDLRSIAYNMPYVLPLGPSIDKEKLENTFRKLISRHESLRTSFRLVNEMPVQNVCDSIQWKIDYYEVKINEGIQEIINAFVKPFDLSQAPLLRVGLIKNQGQEYILLIDMHHIITDGISQAILKNEFTELYKGTILPPLKLHYKDYSEWQKHLSQREDFKKQEEYWIKEFQGEIPVLNMPIDFPRPSIQSYEGNILTFEIEMFWVKELKRIALAEGATLFMVLLAISNILLSKLSGQEDIIIGTPIAGRRHADLEKIIGMFVNTLAMRNTPCGEKRFSEFLTELKEHTLKAYENQEYQFEELVEKLSVPRDTGRNPIFDVMFNVLNIQEYNNSFPGTEEHRYNHRKGISKFDLALTAVDRGNECLFNIEYSTRLFKPETIDRFISYFKRLLDSLSEDFDKKLYKLDIITEVEKHRILYEFNNTEVEYPKDKTIHQLFEEQTEKIPDYIVVLNHGQIRTNTANHTPMAITYRELNEKSKQLTYILIEKGVYAGNVVGIMVERSVEMIVGILGTLKSGGAYLPIEPEYPPDRIDYMLKDSGASILIKKSEVRNSKSETNSNDQKINDPKKNFEDLMILDFEFVCTSDFDIRASNLNSSNIAYIIYTSGSTGRPKGVMVEHRNVVRLVKNASYIQYSMQDRLLPTGSAAFDISTFEIWSPLLNSFALLLVSKEIILNPEMLKEVLVKYDISILHLIPQLFNQMAEHQIELFSRLRYFLVGGDLVKPRAVNKLHDTYPHLKIIQCYGPTENTTFSTTFRVDKNYDLRIPIGKPIGNSCTFIVDKYDHLQPVGVPGELLVGGDGIALGYLNKPELTAEKFIDFRHSSFDLPRIHHSKLYRTGDLARWLPDGNIEFLGRIDHQVKIRGFRIELEEIENCLSKIKGIKEVVVMVREDQPGDKYLCAYIASAKEYEITELRDYLSKLLPGYMIPSYFVTLDKIPLTSNGKVDRKALPKPKAEAGSEYEAPRDKVEENLVDIWADVLRMEKDIIGINSNFFELGGHSLRATILVSKIQKNFDVHISLPEIFKTPTIKTIASLIKMVNRNHDKEIDNNQKMEEIII